VVFECTQDYVLGYFQSSLRDSNQQCYISID
jgi:hypothetical protein